MSLLEIASAQRSSMRVQTPAHFPAWTMPSSVNWRVLLQMCLLAVCCLHRSTAIELPTIYWNASNPIFRIDNTDHIMDVNRVAGEYDRVNIRCPRMKSESGGSEALLDSYYIIYNVSRDEYETCTVANPAARRILVCDQPRANADTRSYITITFRPFTPQPNGLEFHAGQDYYFISTSSGSEGGLDNRVGGRCASDNMKLIFKVAGKEQPVGGGDSDERVTVKKTIPTTFRLPFREPFLPAYETFAEEEAPIRATTMPSFFRIRTTPCRPRIMKFRPTMAPVTVEVEQSDHNNDLPPDSARSSVPNYVDRSKNKEGYRGARTKSRTTTHEYFNTIREEQVAVPAMQTKARPASMNAASGPLFYGIWTTVAGCLLLLLL